MLRVISIALALTGLFLISACQSEGETVEHDADGMTQQEQAPPPQDQQAPQMQQQPGADMDISDDDLRAFAEIDSELRMMQEDARSQMIDVIENHGMTLEEFQQHSQMQQQGMTDQIPEGDAQAIADINDEKQSIQETIIESMETLVEDHGMSVDEYEQLAMVINQNPDYQQRLMEMQQ